MAESAKGKKLNVPGCVKDERVHAAGLSGTGKETPCCFHRWMSPKRFKVTPFLEKCGKTGLEGVWRGYLACAFALRQDQLERHSRNHRITEW